MRKLKLQVQISVDGYIAGPNGEMDWMVWNWDDALNAYITELTEPVDTILLGRKLADGFIDYWDQQASDPNGEDGARKISDTQKFVFSRTLETLDKKRTTLIRGDLGEEVRKLKQQEGGDMIVYGGAEFVSSLVKESLIDELHLLVNPSAIENGLKIFRDKTNLKLKKVQAFDCGIVLMMYTPA
jgi:dihydrofolate reductase